jgi:beta-galactosidase
VRLYLNDQFLGEKPSGPAAAFKTVFSVPYRKGILKAVGIQSGREMESEVLQTAGPVAAIRLVADRGRIDADGQDLSYVKVELVDKNGVIQPNGDNQLDFEISGAGTIAGVDNANLKDPDPYFAHSRKAWKGKALVVIKSTHHPGTIELNVHAKGLPVASLQIQSNKGPDYVKSL